jgi:uncharacterized protein
MAVADWFKAGKKDEQAIYSFLLPREYRAVTLSSRISKYGQLSLPGKKEASLWILDGSRPRDPAAEGDKESGIRALVLICTHGLVLPLFHETEGPSLSEIEALFDRIGEMRKKIYCILGRREEALLCESALGKELEGYRTFLLMTCKQSASLSDSPNKIDAFRIQRVRESDAERFFPLERAYQLEEVVLSRDRYHDAAGRIHFKNQCKRQIIFASSHNGNGIAKAGTNAIGIRYCQVGGVFTRREFRKQGYAKQLMLILLHRIFARGQSVSLFVRYDNPAAVALYRSLGFIIRGEYRIAYPKRG